jgi:glyoxylase-like metal-dependent hydrolase (beta-lactamase superfamily II)
MEYLKVGGFEFFWLSGGTFRLDGGTMFGVVPKALWSRKFPPDDENCIGLVNSPLLLRGAGAVVLVDTGLGNKLTGKQKEVFRVEEEWDVLRGLGALGLKRWDVTHVVLTHCDFDHAGGVVMLNEREEPELVFPEAEHIVQRAEWEDVLDPNRRSSKSYWPQNFTGLEESGNLRVMDGEHEPVEGVRLMPTGGHTRGHQVLRVASGGAVALHMADLLPTHANFNPLWVSAYDNFPLEAVARKEELLGRAVDEDAWLTFYHDPFMDACKFDREGNVTRKWVQPRPPDP